MSVDLTVLPDAATGLYDTQRLARVLNVKPATIRTMRKRQQLPEPTSSNINGGAVWTREAIVNYFAPAKKKITFPSNPLLPTVIDLFAGCGGLSLGFQKAGFALKAGFDSWQHAVDVYNENLDHPAHILDLSDVDNSVSTLLPFMDGVSGIIGGPPCQDFSSAGKRTESDRADLTEKFATIVTKLNPKFFVMENVARAKHSAAFGRAVQIFRENGYGVTEIVLDASKCGAPQARKRLFTIGLLGAEDNAFEASLLSGLAEKPMTMRDHFGSSLDLDYYYRHPRSYARRGIYSMDEPSATIRGVNRPVPPGYSQHPGDRGDLGPELRPLTTQERALVQTFPPEFTFSAAKTHTEQMIGNAVPVNLASYVAKQISKILLKELVTAGTVSDEESR